MKKRISRGDVVRLTRAVRVFVPRTPNDFSRLRKADAASGRWCDDGGEPILYGPYGGLPEGVDELDVTVTSLRPKWSGWNRRPKGLTGGYSDILDREILFVRES